MAKAKDMVQLAAELNEKLTAVSSTTTTFSSSSLTLVPSTEPEEATFIRSSLSQLGLQMANAPVTPDMMKDERKWIEELARELAGVLQGGIMKERGIIALDEVWGGWNRARGVGAYNDLTANVYGLTTCSAYTPIDVPSSYTFLAVIYHPNDPHAHPRLGPHCPPHTALHFCRVRLAH